MQATRTIDPSPLPQPSQAEADFQKTHGMPVLQKALRPVEHEVPWPTQADANDLASHGIEVEVIEAVPRSLEVEPPTPTQVDADIARRFGLPELPEIAPAAAPGALVDPTQPEANVYKIGSAGVLQFITAWDSGATFWDDRTTVWDRTA